MYMYECMYVCFKFRSAFGPRSADPAVVELLFVVCRVVCAKVVGATLSEGFLVYVGKFSH